MIQVTIIRIFVVLSANKKIYAIDSEVAQLPVFNNGLEIFDMKTD